MGLTTDLRGFLRIFYFLTSDLTDFTDFCYASVSGRDGEGARMLYQDNQDNQ